MTNLRANRVPGAVGRLLRHTLDTLLSGERQDADVLAVEQQNGYAIVNRSTTAQVAGTTGAAGDNCEYIRVITPPTTNALVVSDGGTDIGISIPTTANAGEEIRVEHLCVNNFQVDADTNSPQDTTGSIKFVGRFT